MKPATRRLVRGLLAVLAIFGLFPVASILALILAFPLLGAGVHGALHGLATHMAYDTQACSQMLQNDATFLATVFAFTGTFVFLVLQLTFGEIELCVEELKKSKVLLVTTGICFTTILVCLSLATLVQEAHPAAVGSLQFNYQDLNPLMSLVGFALTVLSVAMLGFSLTRIYRYFGYKALLATAVENLLAYLRSVRALDKPGALHPKNDILDLGQGPGKEPAPVVQHENEELINYLNHLKKILVKSEHARRDRETLVQVRKIILLSTELNTPLPSGGQLLSNKMECREMRLFQDCWIEELERHLGAYYREAGRELGSGRVGWGREERVLREERLARYLNQLRDLRRREPETILMRNALIEDWLFDLWRDVFLQVDDLHFLKTVIINHQHWVTDMLVTLSSRRKGAPSQTDEDDVLAIIFLFVRIGVELLRHCRGSLPGAELERYLERFHLIHGFLHDLVGQQGRTPLLGPFLKANLDGFVKYLIELNQPQLFKLLGEVRDRPYRSDHDRPFNPDRKEDRFSVYVKYLRGLFPESMDLLPLAVQDLLERIHGEDHRRYLVPLTRHADALMLCQRIVALQPFQTRQLARVVKFFQHLHRHGTLPAGNEPHVKAFLEQSAPDEILLGFAILGLREEKRDLDPSRDAAWADLVPILLEVPWTGDKEAYEHAMLELYRTRLPDGMKGDLITHPDDLRFIALDAMRQVGQLVELCLQTVEYTFSPNRAQKQLFYLSFLIALVALFYRERPLMRKVSAKYEKHVLVLRNQSDLNLYPLLEHLGQSAMFNPDIARISEELKRRIMPGERPSGHDPVDA